MWASVAAPSADESLRAKWHADTARLFDGWLAADAPELDLDIDLGSGAGADAEPAAETDAAATETDAAATETDAATAETDAAAAEADGPPRADGGQLAAVLLAHAAEVAPARLLWGAGFLAGRPRWWPVQVVAQVASTQRDPDYLLDVVGARSTVEGIAPHVEYLTTDYGDGVRVVRAERATDDRVNALVTSALRVESPGARCLDLVLVTRVWDMTLLGVLGAGLDELLTQLAAAAAADAGDLASTR